MNIKQLILKTLKDTNETPYGLSAKMRKMGYSMPFQKVYRLRDKNHANLDNALDILKACRKCLGMSWAEFGKHIDN